MKLKAFALKRLATAMFAACVLSAHAAGTLVINTDASDPAPKAAWDAIVEGFEAEHPDVKVEINTFDHEGYKTSIRNFLTASPPDVVTWYAGNRMAPFVNAGLFEDVSDLWASEGLDESLKSTAASMTIDGKKWGVPYTYYQWGIYYRKDLFEKMGLAAPTTWQELLDVSAKLKAEGIAPFAIGTKQVWTTGGWFDYLNLRVNGYDFHMELTSGKVPWTDPRVAAVFDHWDQLVKPDYYIANHTSFLWQEALPAFVKGEAAMYLIGNFAVAPMKGAGLTEDQIGFIRFPTINPDVERAEDAPTDTAHIPAKAKNKEDARLLLAYMVRPEVQSKINGILGQLPVNRNSAIPDDVYLKAGFEMLSTASALAQFFDRDASPQMAKAAMDGFQRYMARPDDRDAVLKRLEQVRKRINK